MPCAGDGVDCAGCLCTCSRLDRVAAGGVADATGGVGVSGGDAGDVGVAGVGAGGVGAVGVVKSEPKSDRNFCSKRIFELGKFFLWGSQN